MSRGIVPPLIHGILDYPPAALSLAPLASSAARTTTALVFNLAVGAAGLVATLATRFEPRMRNEQGMTPRIAA